MGKIKIYSSNTRGNVDYKLKKLIRELEPIIERKMITDANFAATFRTATTPEELQRLHSVHCAETATIISETKNESTTNLSNMGTENTNETKSSEAVSGAQKQVIDPINEAEPIIRDYVLQGDAYEQKSSIPSPDARNNEPLSFGEPMNFKEAFDIPVDIDDESKLGDKKEGDQKQQSASQNNTQQATAKKEPVNPYFDEQSNKQKNKQTRRMAKYIVKVVVTLLEKGFVWWTTKDINEAKLIELELKGEIDLTVLFALSETEQQTAREFFARMCKDAIAGSKVDLDDQEELTDALFEVLIEKGIAPTPMQNLALVTLQIVGAKVLTALGINAMSNSILAGLKENHKQTLENDAADEEAMMNDIKSNPGNEEKSEKTNTAATFEEAQEVN